MIEQFNRLHFKMLRLLSHETGWWNCVEPWSMAHYQGWETHWFGDILVASANPDSRSCIVNG